MSQVSLPTRRMRSLSHQTSRKLVTCFSPRYCVRHVRKGVRTISNSFRLDLAAKTHYVSPKKASINQKTAKLPIRDFIPDAKRQPQANRAIADELARKNSPTLLYTAPSHFYYRFAAYAGGTFCLAYAGYNIFDHLISPLVKAPKWATVGLTGVSVAMAGFGGLLFLRTSKLISRITAIPRNGKLVLRFDVRRAFSVPWQRQRIVEAWPSNVTMSSRITDPPAQSEMGRKRAPYSQHSSGEAATMRKSLKPPSKRSTSRFWQMFVGQRRLWTQEGFIHVKIKGKNGVWKLDTTGDFFDRGNTLDKLVKHDFA